MPFKLSQRQTNIPFFLPNWPSSNRNIRASHYQIITVFSLVSRIYKFGSYYILKDDTNFRTRMVLFRSYNKNKAYKYPCYWTSVVLLTCIYFRFCIDIFIKRVFLILLPPNIPAIPVSLVQKIKYVLFTCRCVCVWYTYSIE